MAAPTLRDLIEHARTEPEATRAERFRDRIAAHGDAALKPLAALRDDPVLQAFAVLVLERMGKTDTTDAILVLRDFVKSAPDDSVRRLAKDAVARCVNPLRPPPMYRPPIVRPLVDPPAVIDRPVVRLPDRHDQINDVRHRRGEPAFDAAELAQVMTSLARRANDPRRYVNHCWLCKSGVDEAEQLHCGECTWLVCWCGACRDPKFAQWSSGGRSGPCVREMWALWPWVQQDVDFRGVAVVSPAPPVADAELLMQTLAAASISAVYHWTPLRGIGTILRHGILSRSMLERSHAAYINHNLGTADKRELLQEFVALSFRSKPLMMQAWSEAPVVLEVRPDVLTATGTMFVPGNSASSAFSAEQILRGTGLAGLTAIIGPRGLVASQAEAWVPTRVPVPAITQIHAQDASIVATVREAMGQYAPKAEGILVSVSPEMFKTVMTPAPPHQ